MRLTRFVPLLALVLSQTVVGQRQRAVATDPADVPRTAGVQPLACPTGSTIPNFEVFDSQCPTGPQIDLEWDAPAGADSSTMYEVYRSEFYADVCSVPGSGQRQYSLLTTTSNTAYSYNLSSPTDRVYAHFVKVQGCEVYSNFTIFGDTFTTKVTPPVVTATLTGSNQVTVGYRVPDARSFCLLGIERSFNDGAFTALASPTCGLGNYCPANSQRNVVDNNLAPGTYRYRAVVYGDRADCYADIPSTVATVVVPAPCVAPGAPTLSGPTSLQSGKSLAVTWTAAANLAPGGDYVLETSTNGFQTIAASLRTGNLSAVVTTTASASESTLSVRVRAVQACGSIGPNSGVLAVRLLGAPASFLISRAGPAWTLQRGSTPPSASVTFRNIGGQTGLLSVRSAGSFFTFGPSTLTVPAGAEASVTLAPTLAALSSPGVFQGSLIGAFDNSEISTPVSLTVVDNTDSTGAKARASASSVIFSAAPGQNPSGKSITINVSDLPQGRSVYLSPTIGPGGGWLELGGVISQPVPGNGVVTLPLTVNRSRRARGEGAGLYRTILRLTPSGGNPDVDAAVVEVLDVDTLSLASASGLRGSTGTAPEPLAVPPPPGGSSFILPTAVKAVSGVTSAVFTSDGWLRNLSDSTVSADIFCTANGVNGLTATAGLIKTTAQLSPGSTFRMSDLMSTVFQVNNVSANIEVRSNAISSLTFRSSTDSILGGNPATRFGTEIPVVSFGSGVGLGEGELMLAGIDQDAQNRANLILAETVGAEANVMVTVNAPDGRLLGSTTATVKPFSKDQIDRIVEKAVGASATLSGGWAGVSVTSGAGRVVPVATVIDNASGSFSAVLGQAPSLTPGARRAPLAGTRYMIPTVARTIGINNTLFFTSLSLVNGTAQPAALSLTYNYVDQDDGGREKTSTKSLTIPGRGSLSKTAGNDVVRDFFGVTNRSFGYIVIEGALDRLTGVSKVSAQVDPNDPSKGFNSSQVNGIFLDSPSVMGLAEVERRFAGLEKSFQRRSNLIMIETEGQAAKVMVRLYSLSGEKMAEAPFDVGPGQYRQLTDVFGNLNLGEGPYQNVEVTAQVVEGNGRVLAVASVIDNISRSPQLFLLTQPGPPPNPSIGF